MKLLGKAATITFLKAGDPAAAEIFDTIDISQYRPKKLPKKTERDQTEADFQFHKDGASGSEGIPRAPSKSY